MRATMLLVAFVSVGLCAAPVAAAIAPTYEGMQYGNSVDLDDQGGGSNWDGNWSTPGGLATTIVAPDTLSYAGLDTSEGLALTESGMSLATYVRQLPQALGGDANGFYLSFLLQPRTDYGFAGGLSLGELFIGLPSFAADYGLQNGLGATDLSDTAPAVDETVLLVLRGTVSGGSEVFDLFVNPDLSVALPETPDSTMTITGFTPADSILLYNAGNWATDEIRIGPTFDSVVPEPAALALLLVPAPLFLLRRRRRS